MATYCQVSDVQRVGPQIVINAQSRPSDGDVRTMIEASELEISSVLENCGYVVPVVEAAPKGQVTDLVAHHVLAKVLRARAYGSGNEVDLKAAKAAQDYIDGRLKKLYDEEDPYELTGASRTDQEVPKRPADLVRSFVETLDTDATLPPVTVDQVF